MFVLMEFYWPDERSEESSLTLRVGVFGGLLFRGEAARFLVPLNAGRRLLVVGRRLLVVGLLLPDVGPRALRQRPPRAWGAKGRWPGSRSASPIRVVRGAVPRPCWADDYPPVR